MVKMRTALDIWNVEDEDYALFFDLDEEPSLTKQSFKDECDINNILKRYEKTGLIDHVNQYQGNYADLTGCQDYHSALNQVIAAEEAFMSLPAFIRSRFDNDPGSFLAFVEDPNNEQEMIQMGLKPGSPKVTGPLEKEGFSSDLGVVPAPSKNPGKSGTVDPT